MRRGGGVMCWLARQFLGADVVKTSRKEGKTRTAAVDFLAYLITLSR